MPTDFGATAVRDVCAVLNGLLADAFALYLKTKNFHWHVSGPHFATTTASLTTSPSRSSR
jgi:starvation-inducible DNA-binding protein